MSPAAEATTAYDPATIELGASITVDGICLTVTDKGTDDTGNWFEVFAALETLGVTEVGQWRQGRRINLERSLKIGDELGGHIVSGHIDGMATLVGKEPTQFLIDPSSPEGKSSGLNHASAAKCHNLVTVAQTNIILTLGHLSDALKLKLGDSLKDALELPVTS